MTITRRTAISCVSILVVSAFLTTFLNARRAAYECPVTYVSTTTTVEALGCDHHEIVVDSPGAVVITLGMGDKTYTVTRVGAGAVVVNIDPGIGKTFQVGAIAQGEAVITDVFGSVTLTERLQGVDPNHYLYTASYEAPALVQVAGGP